MVEEAVEDGPGGGDVAQEFAGQPIVQEILEFIRAGGKRSLCTPKEAGEA